MSKCFMGNASSIHVCLISGKFHEDSYIQRINTLSVSNPFRMPVVWERISYGAYLVLIKVSPCIYTGLIACGSDWVGSTLGSYRLALQSTAALISFRGPQRKQESYANKGNLQPRTHSYATCKSNLEKLSPTKIWFSFRNENIRVLPNPQYESK